MGTPKVMVANLPISVMDGQPQAGAFSGELRKLAIAAVVAGARGRFVRGLAGRGVGTRVIEDKAGGLALERVNALGGFRGLGVSRAGTVQPWGRCFRDPAAVSTLMGYLVRGVRASEREARRDFLMARARAIQHLGPEERASTLAALQSLQDRVRAHHNQAFNTRLHWAVSQATDCANHRTCKQYRKRLGLPVLPRTPPPPQVPAGPP